MLEGAVVKRLAFEGRNDGVAVIAEGIAERLDEADLAILADVPRDEHGHIRLAEVPLAKVLRNAVTDSLAKRGVKIASGEKDVGYELRCNKPTAYDRDYTRDLGAFAVFALQAGTQSVLITRQAENIVPVPFARHPGRRRPARRACATSTPRAAGSARRARCRRASSRRISTTRSGSKRSRRRRG